mmetsp:Transcript_16370/g.47396  ORF Transcript_16370/g.47396 Transcript_16370/m.47396 type:complete len:215 (-) Transcript_16370:55-699(-)
MLLEGDLAKHLLERPVVQSAPNAAKQGRSDRPPQDHSLPRPLIEENLGQGLLECTGVQCSLQTADNPWLELSLQIGGALRQGGVRRPTAGLDHCPRHAGRLSGRPELLAAPADAVADGSGQELCGPFLVDGMERVATELWGELLEIARKRVGLARDLATPIVLVLQAARLLQRHAVFRTHRLGPIPSEHAGHDAAEDRHPARFDGTRGLHGHEI